jgi:predicted RNase H-like nuclease
MADYIHVIGIDCAVDPRKVGIASGIYEAGRMQINDMKLGTHERRVSETVFELCKPHNRNLIAIDAPLGWPQALGESLVSHIAGDGILVKDNMLFRRETDRFIKRKIGKQPLDVGADRIARTAHAALKIVKEISELAGFRIPLAWNNEEIGHLSVIEVYPAATLQSYHIPSAGYKKNGLDVTKSQIITALNNHVNIPVNTDLISRDSNALDSVVCILAAQDFLNGDTYQPERIELAKKEGWIWVRSNQS